MGINLVVLIIIGCNVLFSMKGFSDERFFREYEFHIGSIRAGQKYRMFTSAFLHADVTHLLFNMIALFSFAPVITNMMGNFAFLLIYFGSLFSGSLLTLILHNNDLNYRAIGASGAVTGIVYSAILLDPNLKVNMFFIPIDIPGYVFGVLYLLYSIYGMKAQNDNIGHTAHFGGAIGGYVLTILKEPYLITENTFIVVLLAIPIIILFFLSKNNKL